MEAHQQDLQQVKVQLNVFKFCLHTVGRCECPLRQSSKNPQVPSKPKHPISPLVVKVAQWLLNRHMIHVDGLAARQRCFRQQSLPGLVGVGEILSFKAHGSHDVVNAGPSFTEVYGLGRALAVVNTSATEHCRGGLRPIRRIDSLTQVE